MAPAPQSAYQGTWDSETQKYVLPPLVGLPFSEMRKNGMGARYAGDTRYHRLIIVHGIFAAFAVLIMIPAALICARFLHHGRNPRAAMWGHIGLNTAALLSLTITFVSGYVAVGQNAWGSNPHHLIGVTLYGAVIFQAMFGLFIRARNQKKVIRKKIAFHTMLHHWLGRGIWLLGLAQIPLGLYLYGSPLVLFILYAVCVFIFFLSWFICEYMRTRGYFSLGITRPTRETPDMAEIPTAVEDTSFQAGHFPTEVPQRRSGRGRGSMWSNLFSRRQSSAKEPVVGVSGGGGYATDVTRATSFDTSRAPSAHSPAIGGLHAPPGRHNNMVPPVPPVPSLPTNYGGDQDNDQIASPVGSGDIHRDNGDRYLQEPGSVRDTVLRDSTTLGTGVHGGPSHIEMPHESPVSPPYTVTPVTSGPANMSSPHTSDISGNSSGYLRSYPMPPYHTSPHRQHEEMPPSPIAGGGYMEADNGFVHGPARHGEPPMAPLPLPPDPRRGQQQQHRRDRSADSVPRLPTSHSTEHLPAEERAGEASVGRRNSRKKDAQVSVQVRVNPDGKSVTVRRVPAEESERDRRERVRLRAERAAQREMSLDRERQHRRSQSGRRSSERHERHERPTTSGSGAHVPPPAPASSVGGYGPESSVGGYAPSIGGQSSTIAGASGGLLGGSAPPLPQPQAKFRMPEPPRMPDRVLDPPIQTINPLHHPVSSSPLPYGGVSPSARGSVVSASGTAENSELEQEAAKTYRKKKLRDGTSSLGNPLSSLGARHDEDGVEWT
ncbi:hypothetical protein L873DRAFT_1830062 [Choiromyces venosus 120613-1]|uniref:Cytochrome b561 domain-containing protein n=1 Tax=Choiromyces venosus 120613-1 TaxID=1336337 RepID=A0A3N4J9K2_9PEZI|nr:hypothetical protein L873DRAFT_1830062 [Choiromyces venosus 120613-1]